MFAGEVYVAVPPTLQKDIEEAARKQLEQRLVDNDPKPLADAAGRGDVERAGVGDRELTRRRAVSTSSSWARTAAARWRTC